MSKQQLYICNKARECKKNYEEVTCNHSKPHRLRVNKTSECSGSCIIDGSKCIPYKPKKEKVYLKHSIKTLRTELEYCKDLPILTKELKQAIAILRKGSI